MSQIPSDFHLYWRQYLLLNPDLTQDCSYEEALQHYSHHGFYENRKYKNENENGHGHVNILVVIVSCNKHEHLWQRIKERTSNNLLIITGSKKNETWYDKNNKMLYLNCNDMYDGLPEKIITMIQEVLHNPEFRDITHIIKIDDHDNFFTDNDIKSLYSYNELFTHDYLGKRLNNWNANVVGNYHFGKVPKNSYWHNRVANISHVSYFDGGNSYILSRRAMQIINSVYNSSNIDQLRKDEIYEDLMIGRILNNHNIHPCRINYSIIGDK